MIQKLLKNGILSIAQEPDNNPKQLSGSPYTATLIEHDYAGKTPAMWNAVYREYGIKAESVMVVGDTSNMKEILSSLRDDPLYLGGGAGVGFKDKVGDFLDELDSTAEAIGSVNFIAKTKTGKLRGYNTDGEGYAGSIEDALKKTGRSIDDSDVVVLGAGGTGRAIVFALAGRGARVVVLNRTIDKARQLAEHVNSHFGIDSVSFGGETMIPKAVLSADAVVNVSTKGATGALERYIPLGEARLPATEENIKENEIHSREILALMRKDTIISDIILRNEKTPFLSLAHSMGFVTLDGIPMVVGQGVLAIWILHGSELEENGIPKKDIYKTMKNAAGL